MLQAAETAAFREHFAAQQYFCASVINNLWRAFWPYLLLTNPFIHTRAVQKSSCELAFLAICSPQQLLTSHVPCHIPDHSNLGARNFRLFTANKSPWKIFNNFKTLTLFRTQVFPTTDDYQFSTITTIIILWGFYPEDTDDQEMFETYKISSECLVFWQSNTLSALLTVCSKFVFVFQYFSYGKRVCCEETCTLVLLQWIMNLFRDHALPN